MRSTLLPALVVAGLVFVGLPAAADGVTTAQVEGQGQLSTLVEDGTVAYQADRAPAELELEAETLDVTVVDDERESVRSDAGGGGELEPVSNAERNEEDHSFQDATLTTPAALDPNATLVVEPDASPVAQHEVAATGGGPFEAEPVPERTLEQSHWVDEEAPENKYYYEYAVDDVVGLQTETSTVEVEGTFHLYIWGHSVEVEGADDATSFRTGHWEEGPSQGVDNYAREHYVHALVSARNATLTLDTGSAQALGMYGERLEIDAADDGVLRFLDASGTLEAQDGTIQGDGSTLVASDGTYDLGYGDGDLTATTSSPPEVLRGGGTAETLGSVVGTSAPSALGALVLVAGLVAGATLARPHLETVRAWWRERRVDAWMAAGDRFTGVRDYERAHGAYAKITERYPSVTEAWYSKAVALQELGRHEESGEAFLAARENLCEEEPELLDMGAAELWRAGEREQARELFVTLYEVDADRVARRLEDAEFADLRDEGPWTDDGVPAGGEVSPYA